MVTIVDVQAVFDISISRFVVTIVGAVAVIVEGVALRSNGNLKKLLYEFIYTCQYLACLVVATTTYPIYTSIVLQQKLNMLATLS